MDETIKKAEKQLRYRKLLGVGLMAAAALYCIPELRKALCLGIEFLTDEWRNWYDGQQR